MDEKKMAEEFAKIWKAVGENSGAIIDTNRDLGKIATRLDKHRDVIIDNFEHIIRISNVDHQRLLRRFNRHIDIFNKNVDVMNQNFRMFQKYAKRQNIIIIAGIGGFLYLCKKIQKLEDATKKE